MLILNVQKMFKLSCCSLFRKNNSIFDYFGDWTMIQTTLSEVTPLLARTLQTETTDRKTFCSQLLLS